MPPNTPKKQQFFDAYIGLGSNLGDRLGTLRKAIKMIAQLPDTELLKKSSWYESEAVGGVAKKDFINGVIQIATKIPPENLIDHLLNIEKKLGRVRFERWGDRTCDLDLLLYADVVSDNQNCQLPHPYITKRAFVLLPLAQIQPLIRLPKTDKTIGQLAENISTKHWIKKCS